jgi:hypothetical protein
MILLWRLTMREKIIRLGQTLDNYYKQVVAVIFAIMVILGAVLVKDYGMPWDDIQETDIAMSNIKAYVGIISGENSKLYTKLESSVLPI